MKTADEKMTAALTARLGRVETLVTRRIGEVVLFLLARKDTVSATDLVEELEANVAASASVRGNAPREGDVDRALAEAAITALRALQTDREKT